MIKLPRCLSLVLAASTLPVVACRPQGASEAKWAFSSDLTRLGLFQLLPDRSVNVCDRNGSGGTADVVLGALKAWADTIGRSSRIKFQKACDAGDGGALIDVYGGTTGSCGGGAIACAESGRTLRFAVSLGRGFETNREAALHEAGHVWGNCDRYGGGKLDAPTLGEGCDGKRGGALAASAMQAVGANPQRGITADDVQGMKAMAADPNIAANAAWADVGGADGGPADDGAGGGSGDPTDDTSGRNGECSYADADKHGGWGWNETTKQSCPPREQDDSRGGFEEIDSECSYADADKYGGWGWNETTKQSCPPRGPGGSASGPDDGGGGCSYADADQNGGWGWNETTGQSCAPRTGSIFPWW